MTKRILIILFIIILTAMWKYPPCFAKFKFFNFSKENNEIKRIVLVVIDTLRADHLSCYGYPRTTSPFIDSLAKDGILVKKALAPSPITAPSHTSIFTSLYPLQHKITRNAGRLDEKHITLAEMLRDMGYKTAAFISIKGVFKSMQITQGFDYISEAILPGRQWQQTGDKTVASAIEWLDKQNTKDKLFIFLHLYDPHTPYEPPQKFHEPFINDSGEDFIKYLLNVHKVDFSYYDNDAEKMLEKINAYDGEILFADSLVRNFYQHYKKRKLNTDTLWIITSDHGEALGNHYWKTHGKQVYNTLLHVPLIFHFSSGLHKGQVIKQDIAEIVDIFPTVLDLVKGNLNSLKKKQSIQGISLVPFFTNDSYLHRLAFAQRRSYNQNNKPEVIDPKETNWEDGERYCIQDKKYKYIHFTEGNDEFYDLGKDPYEINNLINKNIKAKSALKRVLLNKINSLKQKYQSTAN